MAMRTRLSIALVALVAAAGPALAHKLKVFAGVEQAAISGYAYFVGGGRARGSTVVIKDARGGELYRGATDQDGRFAYVPGAPADYTVVIDTGEGHFAEIVVPSTRFAGGADARAAVASAHDVKAGEAPPWQNAPPNLPMDSPLAEQRIEAAVARQVRPLLERIEALDARLRLADIVAGISMILGLGGVALWASARRSGNGDRR